MVRRVANRNRGLKEEDALRLVQAFVVSRVIYFVPYLRLTKADREALNATIRKATKTAMGMPMHSSTQRLMDMGTPNTTEELIEAHLSNLRIRLSKTEHGQAVLRKIVWQIEPQPKTAALPKEWQESIETKPLPRNVQAGRHYERRSERAEALARQLEEDPRALCVDASLPKHGTKATVVVTTIDKLVTSASVRTTDPAEAEEVAVALALATPAAKIVVTDSKTTYARYRRGRVSPAAVAFLNKRGPPGRAIKLVRVPAHSQV